MKEHSKTGLGEIKIHRDVISSIAIEATKQIPGVVKIGSNLRSHMLELIGKQDSSAIKIEFDKNNEVTITIPIIVKYGYNIPEIATKTQDAVKYAIENTTNVEIKDINVVVQGIEKNTLQEGN